MTGCQPRLRSRRSTISWTASSIRAARCSRTADGYPPSGVDATPAPCRSMRGHLARLRYLAGISIAPEPAIVCAPPQGRSGGRRQLPGAPLFGPPEFIRDRLLGGRAVDGRGLLDAQRPQRLGGELGRLPRQALVGEGPPVTGEPVLA